MKTLLTVTALALAISTPALASEKARVVNVQDFYKNVTTRVPQYKTVCENVEVPIYGTVQGQASTGDTIVGAIIGGAIGNQFGSGSGKDAMTVLGAITGADVANKRGGKQQVITGYRQEQRCSNHTTYFTETLEKYSHSVITFEQDGKTYRVQFEK
jgi:uncharacterized protein YcfJ